MREVTTLLEEIKSTPVTDTENATVIFSTSEVLTAINSLHKRKAPGPDGIEAEHIIYAGESLLLPLTHLFNSIADLGYIPKSFRDGLLIPILKGPNKDPEVPGNYRGISLLSNFAKLFEKLLLSRLAPAVNLHPLQGGFRPGLSSSHTAFILQEAISSIRENKNKAFVAFLDAQKAFDTVWHAGLLTKLHNKGIRGKIWDLIHHWYAASTTAILWEGKISTPVRISQGVRQGAILSPLLYSIYVDDLLVKLSTCGEGSLINKVYVGSPMYADDLALITDNPHSLQLMIDVVHQYSHKWRYKINPLKSAVLVFGETAKSRDKNRTSRQWLLGDQRILEEDEIHHLGILRSVGSSTVSRTNERISRGRSSFFALNAVGARFGCLHPATTLKLYTTICLPIMLFGSELWVISKTEILMLERAHRKILRTIQGLPTRCPAVALNSLLGTLPINMCLAGRKLNFIFATLNLAPDSLARTVLLERLADPSPTSLMHSCSCLLEDFALPSLSTLSAAFPCTKYAWKKSTKLILRSRVYSELLSECSSLYISECDSVSFMKGRICPQWLASKGDRQMLQRSNFRVRLLVGCDGLEVDTSRFRAPRGTVRTSTCKLCNSGAEDAMHFLIVCPALQSTRDDLLSQAPSTLSAYTSSPSSLLNHLLGTTWLDDPPTQKYSVNFIHMLRQARAEIILANQ